jgi:hypothetical protein
MMTNQQLYPDAAQRILSIVQAACGDIFKAYYLGLPDNFMPPSAAFPLVIVDKVSGTYQVGATGSDDITETVYIHIMVDIKTGLGAPDTDNPVKRQLQTFVEGRDPNTGLLSPTSLLYALRTHLTLNSAVVPGITTINNSIHIAYSEGHYKGLPETRDAVIEVEVTERQMVPNRN